MSTTAYQGHSVTITASFYATPGGAHVDVTGLTVGITDPSAVVEVAPTTAGITHVSTGVYQYTWVIPSGAPLGDHLVSWSANSGAATSAETVAVFSSASTTWCTLDDVVQVTGSTVTQAQLLQAGISIDVACARPYAVDVAGAANQRIGSRDLYWLKTACAYQASWLSQQVDAMTRVDALAVQTGRRMLMLRDTALFLAPLARRAIQHVSWLKDRSVHVQSGFTDPAGALGMDPLSAAGDSLYPWSMDEGGM
jgi:hypothetical protein